MMWKIIQELLPWVLAILVITQYVIPVITNKQTWWLFRRSKSEGLEQDVTSVTKEAKNVSERIENVKSSINKEENKIQEMKDELKKL